MLAAGCVWELCERCCYYCWVGWRWWVVLGFEGECRVGGGELLLLLLLLLG
jgi:hypothetical protein